MVTAVWPTAAVASSAAAPAYGVRLWQTDDGLPRNSVQAVAQTPDGFLWIGTQRGLVRFDGVRFTPVVADDTFRAALSRHPVRALLVTRHGDLWVALDGGGVWQRTTDGRIVGHRVSDRLEARYARTLIERRDGSVWVGGAAGVFAWQAGRWRPVADAGTPLSVFALIEDRAGRVWAGLQHGVAQLDRSQQRMRLVDGTAALGAVIAFAEDPAGALWAGASVGMVRIDRTGDQATVTPVGRRERVRVLHVGGDGTMWIGTDGGVRHWQGDRGAWVMPVGLDTVETTTFCITADREQNLWIGTNAGLYRLRAGQFGGLSTAHGLPRAVTLAVREDRRGAMWIGTWGGGLVRTDGNGMRTFTTRDGLPDDRVFALHEDRRGSMWVGTETGLARSAGTRFEPVGAIARRGPMRVQVVTEDRRGTLWVGTSRGLFRLDGDEAVPVDLPRYAAGSSVRAIVEDARRRLWVAAGLHLYRLDDADRVEATHAHASSSAINTLYVDGADDLWVGTAASGLLRVAEAGTFAFTPSHGVAAEEVLAIVGDDADRLWLSTKRGLLRVSRSELVAVATGRARDVAAASYGARDGMLSTEGTGESWPAAWRRRSGELWFPTTRGVSIVVPASLTPNRAAPPIIIERVLGDGRDVAVADAITVPPGRGDLEFQYTSPSFVAPEKVRFRHRLDGFEAAWTDAGDRRVATYTNVPPGSYRFRVMARNEDGVWSEAATGPTVRVSPRFVQTPWFYGACAAVVGLAVWAAYAIRMRQLLDRLFAVKAERNRMAREIHDTLLQGVAGIGFQLEAARHRLHTDPDGAARVLERVTAHVDSCLDDARRSVRNMRSAWLDGQPLAAALAESGRLMLSGQVTLDVEESHWPLALDRELEAQIFRVAQQAIANAVAHAGATRITVRLSASSRHLRVEVTDDGRGFSLEEASAATTRFGLVGMRERARKLAARLRIDSTPGAGTSVVLTVSLTWLGRLRRAWLRRHPGLDAVPGKVRA